MPCVVLSDRVLVLILCSDVSRNICRCGRQLRVDPRPLAHRRRLQPQRHRPPAHNFACGAELFMTVVRHFEVFDPSYSTRHASNASTISSSMSFAVFPRGEYLPHPQTQWRCSPLRSISDGGAPTPAVDSSRRQDFERRCLRVARIYALIGESAQAYKILTQDFVSVFKIFKSLSGWFISTSLKKSYNLTQCTEDKNNNCTPLSNRFHRHS